MSSYASYVSRICDVIDDVTIVKVGQILNVCLFVCHGVCPHDLTMKDWCHANNILQVYSWVCLVVQVMCHVFVTSSMTSP